MNRGARQTALLMGTALAVLIHDLPAVQAAAVGTAGGQQITAAEAAFDIPAQPLASALKLFARQSGWKVTIADEGAVSGAMADGVNGTMAPSEALRRLLGPVGVSWRATGPGAVVVDKTAAGGAMQLGAVSVEATAQQAPATDGYRPIRTSTATKTDTPLLDVPQSVTVVTQDLVHDLGKRGLGETLEYIPGIQTGQGEGNRDQVTIRGQNTTADFFSNGMRDDLQYFRDTYNVDRVEALMGPNAMIFGRGGGGGVINRVLKEADGRTVRQARMTAGSFDTKRATADFGQAVNNDVAVRLNGMYENSGSFRDHVDLERYGINPTVTLAPADRTRVKLGYEYFNDDRTADRGIPSQNGRPYETDRETFFGNPDLSVATTENHVGDALIEHEFNSGVTVRNRTRYAYYDKFYQNVYANSAVSTTTGNYTVSAYNNLTERDNITNQTEAVFNFGTGGIKHQMLTGLELSRQNTLNKRFNGANQTVSALNPTTFANVDFTTLATHGETTADVAALYFQDEIDLTDQWQVIAGLRHDRFGLDYTNKLNGQQFSRTDNLWSPRLGVVFKPIKPVSLYTSYSVSYLPGSGDQFNALTSTTEALEPEKFRNYEVGAKWDVLPTLSLTAAVYQLDRSKTQSATVNGMPVQTGAQRTRGGELGITGNITPDWQVMGGYGYQYAEITKGTTAATEGTGVGQVPRHTFSLWNKYQLTEMWGAGLGAIYQSDQYAATASNVTLDGFVRFDAAIYANLTETVRAQLNVQNLFDKEYYATAHSANNISPGAPRTFLLSLTSDF